MSGIVRRIDQLGRIVIPIEVRKRLKLEEGSLLDISIENENLILSKNEPLKDFKKYIIDVCESVDNCLIFVFSDSSLIFSNKTFKKFEGLRVDIKLFLDSVKQEVKKDYHICEGLELENKYAYVFPLASFGDKHGYACFFFDELANLEDKGMMSFVSKYISSKL